MQPFSLSRIASVLLLYGATAIQLHAAATITRSFTLRSGWNAVYLDVAPADPTIETVLVSLPVESVWRHQRKLTSVDFIQNPAEPVWNRDQWLVHVPTNRIESVDNNLFQIQGGHSYLVKLTSAANWSVTGTPVLGRPAWKADAFNLRGFPVDASSPPTFREFFKFSPAHYQATSGTLQTIYRLDTTGAWRTVLPTDLMEAGVAYWVYSSGPSDYLAPFVARVEGVDSLDFGTRLPERSLVLANLASSPVDISLAEIASPDSGALVLGSTIPPNGVRWDPLPALQIEPLGGNETRTIRIGVERQSFASATYDSILDVRDNLGTRFLVPVHSEKPTPASSPAAAARAGLQSKSPARRPAGGAPGSAAAGLWIGTATVKNVAEVHSGPLRTVRKSSSLTGEGGSEEALEIVRDPGNPNPTAVRNGFDLRVIVHVDDGGHARLLKEVLQLWRDGTYETNNAGERIVKTPGDYVLLTNPNRITDFKGAGLRDGTPVGRRISSATFDFLSTPTNNFLNLEGTVGIGQTLRGGYTLFPDQPTHPYKHKFHPDHDNLDPTFRNRVVEAYEISRAFEFEFLPTDPGTGAAATPDYGHAAIAGVYRETVSGLHQFPIAAEGHFHLRKVSDIGELDPPASR